MKGDSSLFFASNAAPEASPTPAPSSPASSFLSVEANVRGAAILLDGRRIGETPLIREPVPPGEHKVAG